MGRTALLALWYVVAGYGLLRLLRIVLAVNWPDTYVNSIFHMGGPVVISVLFLAWVIDIHARLKADLKRYKLEGM